MITLRMKNSPPSFISIETEDLLYCSCEAFISVALNIQRSNAADSRTLSGVLGKVEPSQISLGE